ncbi:hypothetical protein MP638_003249, partial [Amoeboaphelidium occidentale]
LANLKYSHLRLRSLLDGLVSVGDKAYALRVIVQISAFENEAEYLCLKDMDNRPLKCKQENDHQAELRVYYLDKFDRGFCGKVLIEIHRTDNKTQKNHGRKCFLGVNRAGNLEVYNHIQTECIWVQT